MNGCRNQVRGSSSRSYGRPHASNWNSSRTSIDSWSASYRVMERQSDRPLRSYRSVIDLRTLHSVKAIAAFFVADVIEFPETASSAKSRRGNAICAIAHTFAHKTVMYGLVIGNIVTHWLISRLEFIILIPGKVVEFRLTNMELAR